MYRSASDRNLKVLTEHKDFEKPLTQQAHYSVVQKCAFH